MDVFTKILKLFLYLTVITLISTFVLGRVLNNSYLLSFTDFQSNGGVWLMFILLIFGVHLPELRVLVREIIEDKIQGLSGQSMYEEMKNKTLKDSDYIKKIKMAIGEEKSDPIKTNKPRTQYPSGSDYKSI